MKTSVITNKSCFTGNNIERLIAALTTISHYAKKHGTNIKFKFCIETDMCNPNIDQYDNRTIHQTPTGDVRFNLTVDLTREDSDGC